MAVQVDPVGLLKLEFIDQNNNKFSETPFYVRGNLLSDNESTANQIGQALYKSIERVVSGQYALTTASYTGSSMTYTVGVDQFAPE